MDHITPDQDTVSMHSSHHQDSAVTSSHDVPLDESESTTAADFEPEHINPSEADSDDHAETTQKDNPASILDPIVLSSLVIQLRTSLEDAYKERDELREVSGSLARDLELTRSALADLEQQHVYISAAKEAVENELKAEKDKREAADESVSLLRSRLEEARKAVTGLQQTQDRRRQTLGYAGPPVGDGYVEDLSVDMAVGEAADKRSRRASGMGVSSPLAHRRNSSQSEPGLDSASFATLTSGHASAMTDPRPAKSIAPPVPPARPNTGGLRELRLGAGAAPSGQSPPSPNPSVAGGFLEPVSEVKDARRWSALTVLRGSPKQPSNGVTMDDVEQLDGPSGKLYRPSLIPRSSSGSLQDRLNAATGTDAIHSFNDTSETITVLQSEVDRLRAQLALSQEARAASENAVKVLREFMSAGVLGEGGDQDRDGFTSPMQGLRLPPLPTDSQADDEEDAYNFPKKETSKPTSWSLRLWNNKEPNNKAELPEPFIPPSGKAEATSPFSSHITQDQITTPASVFSAPLASFVSSWSKGVASPPPSEVQDAPANSRQPVTPGRMLSFFGRSPTTPQQQQQQQHQRTSSEDPSEDPAEESTSRADPAIIAASETPPHQGESETTVADLSDVSPDVKPDLEEESDAVQLDAVKTEETV